MIIIKGFYTSEHGKFSDREYSDILYEKKKKKKTSLISQDAVLKNTQ